MIPQIWKAAYLFPLLKGWDPLDLIDYCPISKLSTLAQIFESGQVNFQLKHFWLIIPSCEIQ